MPRHFLIRSGKDLGLALAEARTVRRLSQAQVADEVGLDRTYLARMEHGLSVQRLDRAVRVLRILGAELLVALPEPAPEPKPPDCVGESLGCGIDQSLPPT